MAKKRAEQELLLSPGPKIVVTRGEACRLTDRRYLGCEIDIAMAERARVRIFAVPPFHDGGAA